ncbi:ATP-grasp fold amidoligase family protein [Staphylococcus delphini]|uniref:ATP-grasp fold amidoligase family protein n=1 Tax=Staphylococcus delphini TaxID=53344 RepID=UPI001CCBE6DD|nr:ATP-grasp fold amidoligase family protein [Staphylococcus delphini]MBZ8174620.1 hypothetical protein [Staphylococcus delphini]
MKSSIKQKLRFILYRKPFRTLYIAISHFKTERNKKLNDKDYIIKLVKENKGVKPNIDHPKKLYEKVLWLKLYYRNPLMITCTDKYEVRQYVKNKGYKHLLTDIYGVYDSFDEINLENLPEKFFMKATHFSGGNQIFDQRSSNYQKAKKKFDKLLNTNYYYKSREWNYKNVRPRIIVEPLLNMNEFVDYKFFVISGKVEFFAIVKDINDDKGNQAIDTKFNLYNRDKTQFTGSVGRKRFDDEDFQFTLYLEDLIHIAEDLALPFPYCRVDFLVSPNRVIFGEITFFPNGGTMILSPEKLEYVYGEKLKLNEINQKYVVKSDN